MVNHIPEFCLSGLASVDKISKFCEEENIIHIEDLNKNLAKKIITHVYQIR